MSDGIREKERQRMLHQINPHLIFNSLAAIQVMIKMDSDMAYDLIHDFSKYLQAVFQSFSYSEKISMSEEISNIMSFTKLERARFGNNIKIYLDIEAEDFMLPPLSIQPLVENAIVHGLKKGKRKGSVWIKSRQTASEYIVQVEDNGAGFNIKAYNRQRRCNDLNVGGLQRVKYRIERQLSGKVELKSIVGYGTVVTLHIPKISKHNNRKDGDGHEHKSYIGR